MFAFEYEFRRTRKTSSFFSSIFMCLFLCVSNEFNVCVWVYVFANCFHFAQVFLICSGFFFYISSFVLSPCRMELSDGTRLISCALLCMKSLPRDLPFRAWNFAKILIVSVERIFFLLMLPQSPETDNKNWHWRGAGQREQQQQRVEKKTQ